MQMWLNHDPGIFAGQCNISQAGNACSFFACPCDARLQQAWRGRLAKPVRCRWQHLLFCFWLETLCGVEVDWEKGICSRKVFQWIVKTTVSCSYVFANKKSLLTRRHASPNTEKMSPPVWSCKNNTVCCHTNHCLLCEFQWKIWFLFFTGKHYEANAIKCKWIHSEM